MDWYKLQPMQPGILLALASAVLFGASTPFAKLLLGSVDPWLMAGLLYIGAGLGLAVVHLSRSALQLPAVEAPLRRSDVPWLAAVILSGGVLGLLLLMLGLARTDAAAASLLLNLAWRQWALPGSRSGRMSIAVSCSALSPS
jgi:drug/metabolite transporter (DMT)-like permease